MRAALDPSFVVLVDDQPAGVELRDALTAVGAQVIVCRRASNGVDAVDFHRPSAIVVDLEMDAGAGWEVLRAGRSHGLPVVALDRTGGSLRRRALAAGADEVVSRPFDATELALRVLAHVQRARPAAMPAAILRHRDLVLDVTAREVRLRGRAVIVTPQQFAILRALLEAGGATLPRTALLARIASLDDEPPSERAIDLHVSRLRRRLGDVGGRPRYIEAVYGMGYRLATAETAGSDVLGGRAAAVLDALPDAIFVVDRDLRIRYANRPAERLLASERGALVGRHCGELLNCRSCDGSVLDGPRCLGRAVLGGRGVLRDEPGAIAAGGATKPVSFSYGEVRTDDDERLLTITLHPR